MCRVLIDVLCIQDGNVELNVPSIELFPIHHLDDLEFFPCDFVASTSGKAVLNKDSGNAVACLFNIGTVLNCVQFP